MKNIQIVDGAANSIFEIYKIPDRIFMLMFPNGNDVAFIDEVERVLGSARERKKFWSVVFQKNADKKKIVGIHGTLHLTASPCSKKYFPTRKEREVNNVNI